MNEHPRLMAVLQRLLVKRRFTIQLGRSTPPWRVASLPIARDMHPARRRFCPRCCLLSSTRPARSLENATATPAKAIACVAADGRRGLGAATTSCPAISYLLRKCGCMTALRSANGTLSCCSGLCRIRAHHQRWRHEANTMSGDDSNFRRLHGVDDARGRLC